MKRQVVIGGLVGIALGGLITFSFAHGVLAWEPSEGTTEPAPTEKASTRDEVDAGFAPHRPLRPGSDRVGKARAKAAALAAAAPRSDAPAV